MPDSPSSLLSELGEIAVRAGRLAQQARTQLKREIKPDGSIVTAADRDVETMLRDALPRLIPGTTVAGEEFGYTEAGPNGLWVVDPVDGTSNFAFGSPFWAVSIGLLRHGEPCLGAVFLPDLNEVFLGEIGCGAYHNGARLPLLLPGPISPQDLISFSEVVIRQVGLGTIPGKMRCVGAAVIDGAWVACGRYRGLVGQRERLHDVAATVVLNIEVGAEIRYLDGAEFRLDELTDGQPIGRPWIIFPPGSRFGLE